MASFSNKKSIKAVITLASGTFGVSDNDQITLVGNRISADIKKVAGATMGTLQARIYGIPKIDMGSIFTTPFNAGFYLRNRIELYAIDGKMENMVFSGDIINCWPEFSSLPDVYLNVQAQSLYSAQLSPKKPISINGKIDVAILMQGVALDLGLKFENNGVHVCLTDVYLPSTAVEQARELARQAKFDLYIDDDILAITNKYASRESYTTVVSSETGMIGYPIYNGFGVYFRTLYNQSIMFGGRVKIETDIPQAAGEWIVNGISHKLESETPNGEWFSTVMANQYGFSISKQ